MVKNGVPQAELPDYWCLGDERGMKICPVCGNETDKWGYCFYHCHYCFKPLKPGEVCSCRYEEKTRPAGTLPLETTLENGKYILGAVLGKGGFGITYLGYQTTLNSRVAIKEYFPSDFVTRGEPNNPGSVVSHSHFYQPFLDKFKREANILRKFNGLPNIVTVYDLVSENNTAYIIMEYVEGESLKDLLRRKGGRISWPELQQIVDPVMSCLQQIHNGQIIHRDIAPDNILIDKTGKPVLIDFGAARNGQNTTGSTVSVGKEGYAPLEQINGMENQDPRTDIYAMGATCYRALTGATPESASSRTYQDTLLPVSQLAIEVPKHVSDAIMKAMAVRIEDRWSSMDEFRNALKDSAGSGAAAVPESQENIQESVQTVIVKQDDGPKTEKKKEEKKSSSVGKVLLRLFLVLLVALVIGFLVVAVRFPQYLDMAVPYAKGFLLRDAESQVWLGESYWFGENGFSLDNGKAFQWFRKAAEQGDPDGEYNLAVCYRDGYGAERSLPDYEKWMQSAADHGSAKAMMSLGTFYKDGFGTEVKPDLNKAALWFQRAANVGDPIGAYQLALCYRDGTGVEHSLPSYEEGMTASAEQGYREAMRDLAVFYEEGYGHERKPNPEKAEYWYERFEEDD